MRTLIKNLIPLILFFTIPWHSIAVSAEEKHDSVNSMISNGFDTEMLFINVNFFL